MNFVKTHALGNDFILVERAGVAGPLDGLARKICNRHFGVGADGLILWEQRNDVFHLQIFNSDGSEAECSGNGLRCAAAYLMEFGRWRGPEIRLQTASGIYTLRRDGPAFEADMGVPQLHPEQIPFAPDASNGGALDAVVNYPLKLDGEEIRITACSTGNPHCSIFVEALDDETVKRVGPRLEHHRSFPNRTNVEFVHVLNDREIEVAFWERGAGWTYASGTGSCAAVVAAVLNGRTGRRVTVHTRGGRLFVDWQDNGRLKLISTANVVAEGRYFE